MREYVFIVTYGRSGSTVLQRVLNSFPGFHIKGENWNTLFPLYRSYQLCAHARYHKGELPLSESEPWFGADQLDPHRYAKALVDVFIREILQPPADAHVIGFKEIRYFETMKEFEPFMEFIKTHFTPVKFIFNTRPIDGILKSKWWATMDEQEVRSRIAHLDEKFHTFADANPTISLVMDHGVWTKGPQHFRPLTDFLGVDFDQAAISRILGEQLPH